MPEVAGKDCVIKVSGSPVAMIGEATTTTGNISYQITNAVKRVLERVGTILVLKKGTNDAAEAGTTTTNLTMTAHGLATGDVIINTTRANAVRAVTYLNANNVTVTAVTGQTTGDVIEVYKQEPTTAYILNRLNGTVTYPSALARTILISGNYLPMSTAAYANSASYSMNCDMLDKTKFGDAYKLRLAGHKYASGSLTQLDMADTYFEPALTASLPVVIEYLTTSAGLPTRFWALLESAEVQAAIDGMQNQVVTWISTEAFLKLNV